MGLDDPIFCAALDATAQCNVNDPYDKLISGYHASVAIKSTGEYSIWGANMAPTGLVGQLTPLEINGTNYAGITGTIYKAGIGEQIQEHPLTRQRC